MLNVTKDIQPVTALRRRPRASGRLPMTLRGKAEAVVQDEVAYQHLLDIAARADVFEAIRQSLDDVASGRTRPARKVFGEIRRKHGIRR